jgi:hypothetical protein
MQACEWTMSNKTRAALLCNSLTHFWMMLAAQALEIAGVRFIGESIGMRFEPANFRKVNDDLQIEPCDFIRVCEVTTGFELMLVDHSPGPTEVLATERLDLDCTNRLINDFVREVLFILVIVALFQPEVVVFTAAWPFAFQAPLTLVPFILPAVTFFPVYLDLKVKYIFELAT